MLPSTPPEPDSDRRTSEALNVGIFESLGARLPALQYHEFKLFWFGQMVSLTGTWVQSVAQQWLVLKLTGSAFKLGLVTTVQFTPLLVLSLLGGVVADRMTKRDLLLITQVASLLLAVGLGTLVRTGTVQYWHVLLFAGLLGTVNAFYTPVRQAFVPELVGKDALLNAVALNSTIFNAARVIGPAIGGILVATLGLSLNFYLNAVSYVAVIASLLLIKPRRPKPEAHLASVWTDLGEGLTYLRDAPVVLTLLLLVGVTSLFALNFTVLVPLLAQYVLHVGSSGYGFLMASTGLGSLCGAIFLSFFTTREYARRLVYVGISCLTVAEIALGFSRLIFMSTALLVVAGLSQTLFATTANTRILTLTPRYLQGRVMSVYSLMFLGMTPFGSLLAGWVAERYGSQAALVLGGSITLVLTAIIFVYRTMQARRAGRPSAAIPPS